MKRRFLFGLIASVTIVAAGCGGGAAGTPIAPTTPTAMGQSSPGAFYLTRVVDLMQANSVNRQRIDWTDFRARVSAAAPDAQTIGDTYGAIGIALGLLDDHHSFYTRADGTVISNPSSPTGCGVALVGDPALPGDIGYVRVDRFAGTAGQEQFAMAIQQAIRERDTPSLAGWIVDLRGNSGGNMWPMLAGVGPVLGAGTAGYFVGPAGAPTPFGYDARGAIVGGSVAVAVTPQYDLRRPNPRVAVLTDRRVASSGEAIAVAFRGRPDTRSFGTPTCGVPTANSGYNLSDGGVLQLTTGLDADRALTTYDSPIAPDEVIDDPSGVVQRAIAWLRASY
jgi:carboxyl-terminal processing protease